MKKVCTRLIKLTLLALALLMIIIKSESLATIDIKGVEYSEKYKQWLELSDEEKEKVIMPAMYDNKVENNSTYLMSINNVMRVTSLLKSSLSSTYNLKNIIPENTVVRNQMETSGCWSFAVLGSLESNLAMKDKQNSRATKIYDFSERHMVYSTTREAFLNNVTNKNGFTKSIGGGNSYIANAYLTNGMGAIPDSEMVFENNENKIEISQIQNKTVSSTLIDSKIFSNPTTSAEREELKTAIKEHITNYGGTATYIYGAQLLSDYYNNATGAIYCDDANICKTDHEVLIIGWDDNYSKENFNEKHRPNNNGAWIIKNSWGTKSEYSLSELKTTLYNNNVAYCNSQGWNSPESIPNEIIVSTLVKKGYNEEKINIDGDTISILIGDNGYMYLSYDDVNVLTFIYGIVNAKDTKDYDNIYQYDVLGADNVIQLDTNVGYLANVFDRDSSKEEYLTKISVNTLMDMGNSKVLINPSSSSKKITDLQEVTLLEGEYETVNAGYNTIEFAHPIKLTGSSFTIVLQVENNKIYVPLISQISNSYYQQVELKSDKSFVTTAEKINSDTWQDLTATSITASLRGNIAMKAFTDNAIEEVSVSKIEIANAPQKLTYKIGEKFDTTGMKVIATYTDGTKKEITSYKITNGENLQLGQNSVTITYTESNVTKTTTQSITVENKEEGNNNVDETKQAPTLSNFEKTNANIVKAASYVYVNKNKSQYTTLTIKLKGIQPGDDKSTREYYYYISGKQGARGIGEGNWTKIENLVTESDGTYSANIQIDSRNIEEISELEKFENLYIYVKENAKLNDVTLTSTNSISIKLDTQVEIYVDDVKQESINSVLDGDSTVASGKIPQTGINMTATIAIIIVAGVTIVMYIRIRKMKDIK